MKHVQTERTWVAFLAWWLFATAATTAFAEVGVSVSDAGGGVEPGSVYVLAGIVDDPDPVGVWARQYDGVATRIALNPGGDANQDGPPSVLYGSGAPAPVVAWSRNAPGGFAIVASRFVNGAWTEPSVVADGPGDDLDPVLVGDPAGELVHLFYWILDGTPRVMHTRAPADLSSWTTPVQVSLPGEIACRPSAALHDGVVRLVYESHGFAFGSTPRHIVEARGDGTGAFEGAVLATTHHAEPNWPQVHAGNGRLWVDWIDGDGVMTWTRQSQTPDLWEPPRSEPFESAEERDYRVRGAIRSKALE